jgi:hypothetical protein
MLAGPFVFAEAAQRNGLSGKVAVTSVGGMQPAQIGIYLNRQSLPAADLAALRDAIGRLVAHGDYSRLVQRYYAEPKWSALGLDARPPLAPKP